MITISKSKLAAALAVAILAGVAAGPAAQAAPTAAVGTGGYSQVCADFSGSGSLPCIIPGADGASGPGSVTLGAWANSPAQLDIAIGNGAFATTAAPGQATAIGAGSQALDAFSIALGASSTAGTGNGTSQGEIAIGTNTGAIGNDSVAIGTNAVAAGTESTALGYAANAQGAGSVSIGYSSANGSDSVALGNGSVANRADSVSVGFGTIGLLRQVTNMAAGTMPTDAVNLSQLDSGGQSLAAWLGGGAAFEAAGSGTFTAPSYVLTSPGAAGTYTNVGSALLALDSGLNAANARISSISLTPGPQGPAGATGATGPAGPQGPGVQPGPGTDTSAVHYDTTASGAINYNSVTLQGKGGTQIHNVAGGSAPTDAANVSQIEQALQTSESFTTTSSAETLTQANAYTDAAVSGLSGEIGALGQRVNALDGRISDAMAQGAAFASMFASCAGTGAHCIAVGGGVDRDHGALTVGYRQTIDHAFSVSAGLSATGHDTSGGVGVGVTW